MKYVKSLGLVAVGAVSLVALVGSGAASAAVLCKTNAGTTCPSGWAYGAGTVIHGVLEPGTRSQTTVVYKTVECTESTFSASTDTEGSSTTPVTASVGTWTFSGCNCDVTILTTGSISIEWIAGTGNGTFRSTGLEETVTCGTIFGTVHCLYATNNTDLGTLTGGNPATLDIANAKLVTTETNGLCDEDTWHAKYEITTPNPLFVTGHT